MFSLFVVTWARVFAGPVFVAFSVIMLLSPQWVFAETTADCPAVNCDCAAISLPSWQAQCYEAEMQIKNSCAANNGVPTQYCTLQGPSAVPAALMSQTPEAMATTVESIRSLNRQMVMINWSIKDDLDNVKEREKQNYFGDALQVEKLLESNIERLFTIQWSAAEGERKRAGNDAAIAQWLKYRSDLTKIQAEVTTYGESLWQQHKLASNDSLEQKGYLALAMKILRLGSFVNEQLAWALAGEGDAKVAAEAWQKAAAVSMDLMQKELATSNNPARANYYRYQAATRWNKASFYWMDAKNDERVAETVAEAKKVLAAAE